MALTRKLLKGMGLTEEQMDTIIEAHTDTVDGLKADLEAAKAGAKDLPKLQKQLERAEADLEAAKKDGWQDKYNTVKKEFDGYKQEQEEKAARSAKEAAYRALLKEAGISEKRLDAVVKAAAVDGVLDGLELDEKGAVKDAAKLTETAKADWADFIVQTNTQGAHVPNPSANSGASYSSKDEIMKIKDPTERQNAIAANIKLFKGE